MGQSTTKVLLVPSWPVPPTSAAKGVIRASYPLEGLPGRPSTHQQPHPLPHPPQAQGTGGRPPLCSAGHSHPSFALGEPRGTSPPVWSLSRSRVGEKARPPGRPPAGDSTETGAISRRLRRPPLPSRWVTKNRTQTSGGRRGGGAGWGRAGRERGTHSGGWGSWDSVHGFTLLRQCPNPPPPPRRLQEAEGLGRSTLLCPRGSPVNQGFPSLLLPLGAMGPRNSGSQGCSKLGMEHAEATGPATPLPAGFPRPVWRVF